MLVAPLPAGVNVPPAACVGSGVELLMMATGALPFFPGTMNRAGCAFVAPPTGIIATARCRPGVSAAWTGLVVGRARAAGAETSCTIPPSVPFWLARTG